MAHTVQSKNEVPVRLTAERWAHIVEEHNELAGLRLDVLETVADPERILAGGAGEFLALREHRPGMWIVVVYKEIGSDGFIITAFVTTKAASTGRRRQLWPR
jgi:hypothetical protein